MLAMDSDTKIFEQVLTQLHQDFKQHPFHYGNEHPIAPELYSRLRSKLPLPTVELDYRQDHSYQSKWRNRKISDNLSQDQRVPRVRPEVKFFHQGSKWIGTKEDYDLAVFRPDRPLIMQGKKQGVGNFVDTSTPVSILCEIKHSRNESTQLRDGAEEDIQALAEYPGEAATRYFVFLDWWPRDGYGNQTFQSDMNKIRERLSDVDNTRIAYLPRRGDMQLTSPV